MNWWRVAQYGFLGTAIAALFVVYVFLMDFWPAVFCFALAGGLVFGVVKGVTFYIFLEKRADR